MSCSRRFAQDFEQDLEQDLEQGMRTTLEQGQRNLLLFQKSSSRETSGDSNNPSNKLRTRTVEQGLEQDHRTRLRTRPVAQVRTRIAQGMIFL